VPLFVLREITDRTEGRVPASMSVDRKIDYAAGQDAKRQLVKRLIGSED
jgi:hypothetical protein